MLELYHGEPNIYFLKPLVALTEARAPFASRYFDPTTLEQCSPEFPHNLESALQLEREGPLLVDGATVLTSSFFVLEYIAESFPAAKLLPGDAYEHYRARAWGQFIALQLSPNVCALGCARYLAPVLRARDQAELRERIGRIEPLERRAAWMAVIDGSLNDTALAAVRERLQMPVMRFEHALAAGPWLAGPAYSIADIDAFAMLSPLAHLAPELVNERVAPRLIEFLARVRARPAVQQALATSKTGKPQEAFVPGAEPSRWG
ncbi:MAG TPA: glutathione S-transferase family protein [Steroidobacteraceae bacterium]|nr:glutathione S-transferase family protein [Steroidobacteraceae bacterium]